VGRDVILEDPARLARIARVKNETYRYALGESIGALSCSHLQETLDNDWNCVSALIRVEYPAKVQSLQ
jgi:hypothetical protein